MLNQSFSPENFRTTIDKENRKGIYLEGKFFLTVAGITEEIKKVNAELREKRRFLQKDEFLEFQKTANEQKTALSKSKEEKLEHELRKVCERVVDKTFRFELKKNESLGAKPVYTVDNKPEYYFASKQLQENFRRLYKVKQANRQTIVSQVRNLLNDAFPKYVIRTDIENFYESIPHDKLITKINRDNLLTALSKKLIQGILHEYKAKAGSERGVPRGIGISAYLAELYMRDIDTEIRSAPGVIYYARYVDDIIIISIPSPKPHLQIEDVKTVFARYDLAVNMSKTDNIDLTAAGASGEIQYLGYKMLIDNGKVTIRLTDKKAQKYRKRIDLTMRAYTNLSKVDEKKARKMLVKRIRFLTGNTRLANNKKNILVGIYYSNSLLTDLGDLREMDKHLENQIKELIDGTQLVKRLSRYRFTDGFEQKRYSPLSAREITEVIKPWHHIR